MMLIVRIDEQGCRFAISCPCGWKSPYRSTLEAAGRDADLHMAEKFPLPSSRRPCNAGEVRP